MADAHAKLGYGSMAARREKVSRWESGRTVPELTAQLAMAHIHGVPQSEVRRLGWPHWLSLASGDGDMLTRSWTLTGALETLRDVSHFVQRFDRFYLAVTGPLLQAFTEQWHAAITQPSRSAPPQVKDPDALRGAQARVQALETMYGTVSPAHLLPVAQSDLSFLAALASEPARHEEPSPSLLLLAARTAGLCAGLSIGLGENALAERYYLLAVRAATAGGDARGSVGYLALVSYTHLLAGAAEDAILLVETVLATIRQTEHPLAGFLHLLAARAHALLGDSAQCKRALNEAAKGLARLADTKKSLRCAVTRNISEEWVALCTGVIATHLGRPQQALDRFSPLLAPSRLSKLLPLGHELLHIVDTQLALGHVGDALLTAQRMVTFGGKPSDKVAHVYRKRFSAHMTLPAVREFHEHLAH
ncbi:hypothetical protein [Streptomyces sp. TLI_146]|uniref:hypothetical protein n=1 Tax=Streptomyces sp. TLI_146 TaxID=1938858 RepID=UPI00117BE50D|nr:hypothetical protein [Streptomyces sp. TLI_146]